MLNVKARAIRKRTVGEAYYLARRGRAVHYAQIRPINYEYHKALETKGSYTTDCSGSTTAILKKSGAPDPNNNHYNGQGYTGTMLAGSPHIKKYQARRGDLVVFGGFPGEHVVMLLEGGWLRDPLVFSHGGEYGPLILRLSSEARYHAGQPMTFLKTVPDRIR